VTVLFTCPSPAARPRRARTVSKKKKPFAWLSLLLVLGLFAAACGGDDSSADDETDGGETPAAAEGCPTDVEGDVIVSGSSTVEPISSKVGELIEECGSGIAATVDGPGTGDGFALFCAGDTDISDASRPISEEEIAACEDNGVDFIELKVAFDGISVLANPANPIECLSFADLYALAGPESEDISSWSDAQALATELGSDTQLPDAFKP
jgi:phosphate transport system substrate-binding protein